jgi:hypothetical protein
MAPAKYLLSWQKYKMQNEVVSTIPLAIILAGLELLYKALAYSISHLFIKTLGYW